jgi:dipeptidyl aminopeptidase/acylaminoacyl peptidase
VLASASRDRTVQLWDVATRAANQTLSHSDWVSAYLVTAVAFSLDGTVLASASFNTTVWLWDVATGTANQTLKGHSDRVLAVAFSPDVTVLASASRDTIDGCDNSVRLWDVAIGAAKQMFKIDTIVTRLSFSEDGRYLNTDRGILNINSESPGICLQEKLTSAIFVNTEWVTRDGQNLLWLPPDYRATCCAVYNNKLVLGHASGMVTYLDFVSS